MTDALSIIAARITDAIAGAFGEQWAETDPIVRPSQNPKFGDYQANVAMSLGKKLGQNPRAVAEAIVARFETDGLCEKPEVAGPGFINIKLTHAFLAEAAQKLAGDPKLGVEPAETPQSIVVDYSSPNLAKEMHVGHLRSTIIGDAIVRVLEALGHEVVRQNHVGDWGTQFGMLIEHMIDSGAAEGETHIADLNEFYQAAKRRFDADAGFNERSRQRVVSLQGGDEQTLALWDKLVHESVRHADEVYTRLGVLLQDDDLQGESTYNDALPKVIEDLDAKNLLEESDGAKVVFPQGFIGKDDEPMPLIVQKSDGGYLYATTDLAAVRYRSDELDVDRIVYVTDARQKQHIAMMLAVARAAGFVRESVRTDHVTFGMVLGEDNKPFKTRAGGTVKLMDLLGDSARRAAAIVREKTPDLTDAQMAEVAEVVGIGAIKYADLSSDRNKDYVFSWQRMLALEGNTAPYMQYAYARVRSIFRKAGVDGPPAGAAVTVTEPAERALVLQLLQIGPTVRSVADNLEPHHLCGYLYDLAKAFSRFFESCPVIKAPDGATRDSRLLLCDTTARALELVLGLLGIKVLQRM